MSQINGKLLSASEASRALGFKTGKTHAERLKKLGIPIAQTVGFGSKEFILVFEEDVIKAKHRVAQEEAEKFHREQETKRLAALREEVRRKNSALKDAPEYSRYRTPARVANAKRMSQINAERKARGVPMLNNIELVPRKDMAEMEALVLNLMAEIEGLKQALNKVLEAQKAE